MNIANEYPFSDEISKKNDPVCGDCISCDALSPFDFNHIYQDHD